MIFRYRSLSIEIRRIPASDELIGETFRDPEVWYDPPRYLGYLLEIDRA